MRRVSLLVTTFGVAGCHLLAMQAGPHCTSLRGSVASAIESEDVSCVDDLAEVSPCDGRAVVPSVPLEEDYSESLDTQPLALASATRLDREALYAALSVPVPHRCHSSATLVSQHVRLQI